MRQGKKSGGWREVDAHVEGEEEGEDKREAVDAVDAGALVGAADDEAVLMGNLAWQSRVPPVEGLLRPRVGHLGDHRLLRGRVARPRAKPDNVSFRSPARVEACFSQYEEYEEDRDVEEGRDLSRDHAVAGARLADRRRGTRAEDGAAAGRRHREGRGRERDEGAHFRGLFEARSERWSRAAAEDG